MFNKEIVLAISCPHLPFEHKDFLDFCVEKKQQTKAGRIVLLGDIFDNHSLSSHYISDPNGMSPEDEMTQALEHIQKWYKAFPQAYLTLGNHDLRIAKKAKITGLPDRLFKKFEEIWSIPKEWEVALSFIFNDVFYFHGDGYSGDNAAMKACIDKRMSVVMGHLHTRLCIGYTANEKNMIFGMNAGCGIDATKYAFEYARETRTKPILGCASIYEGKTAELHPFNP